MAQPPEIKRVEINKWPGRISNSDPCDIPPGAAQRQENIQSLQPGRLTVRKGMQRSQAYTPSSPTAYDIISLYVYQRPDGDYIVTVDTGGFIKARRGGTVKTLATGVSTYAPWSFAKSRFGELLMVNGIDRGYRWDGVTSTAEALGIAAPLSAPAATTPGGGAATAGDYTLAFRYRDDTLPTPVYSSLSPTVTVTAADNDKFSWSSLTAPSESRVAVKELWRSSMGYANVLYYIGDVANGTTTYTTDTASDATLEAAAIADSSKKLLVVAPNGDASGMRQTKPPNYKRAIVFFQDRCWYVADVKYAQGTITTSGSTSLVGSGTAWTSAMVGRYIYIDGEPAPLIVSVVGSATSITTTAAATTSTSGNSYGMLPVPNVRNLAHYSAIDEPESVYYSAGPPAVGDTVTIQENTGDDDELVGAMPFGSVLYFLKERHIYALTFVRQPKIDADCRLLCQRGAFNQRSWDTHEGIAYLIDQSGCYSMTTGGSITPIGDPIQDMFRDGTIDVANSKWFHVCVDPVYQLVRYFVGFTANSSTRPKRAIVYSIRTQAWWTENYPCEIGGSGKANSAGGVKMFVGGQADVVYQMGAGETDVITSQVRGTATAATATSITDSTANFTTSGYNSIVGAPFAIISGTAKGQHGTVLTATSTGFTFSALSVTPGTDSVYLLGSISWTWRGGNFGLLEKDDDNKRGFTLSFNPTTGDNTLDMRRYFNWDNSTEPNTKGENYNNGLVIRTAGSADDVVNLKRARSARGTSAGWAFAPFSGHLDDRTEGKRSITPELGGFKGDDPITIQSLTVHGATP